MSCLGPCYLPVPPREWSRVQNLCTYDVSGSTYSSAYIPLTNQTVSQAQANYEDKLLCIEILSFFMTFPTLIYGYQFGKEKEKRIN
jgi:hypothetical protein